MKKEKWVRVLTRAEELEIWDDQLEQDHTQICVKNTKSILSYFRPIKRDPEASD